MTLMFPSVAFILLLDYSYSSLFFSVSLCVFKMEVRELLHFALVRKAWS